MQKRPAQIVLRMIQAGALNGRTPVIVSALCSVVGARTIQNGEIILAGVGHDEVEFSGGIDEGGGRTDVPQFGCPLQIDDEGRALVANTMMLNLGRAAT